MLGTGKLSTALALLAGGIVLGACVNNAASTSARSGAVPTLHVGYCCMSPVVLPLLVAEEKGFFKKEGVDVRTTRFQQGAVSVAQALAADQIDVGGQLGGPDAVLRLGEKGAHIRMIASLERLSPHWLYAKPAIRSLAELKGKTVVLGGLGGPVWTDGVLMLTHTGLPLKDFKIIQNGNEAQRLALLVSGRADAAIITAPAIFLAQQRGFHSVASLRNVVRGDPEPWVANDAAIRKNGRGILRFLEGIRDAEAYISKNPKGAAAIYAKSSKSNPQFALKSIKIFVPNFQLGFQTSELRDVFRYDKRAGSWKGPIPSRAEIQKYVDDQFMKEVAASSSG